MQADRIMDDRLKLAGMCNAGLYGRAVPQTVSNFLTLVKGGAYQGTAISKVAGSPFDSCLLLPLHETSEQAAEPCCMHLRGKYRAWENTDSRSMRLAGWSCEVRHVVAICEPASSSAACAGAPR